MGSYGLSIHDEILRPCLRHKVLVSLNYKLALGIRPDI